MMKKNPQEIVLFFLIPLTFSYVFSVMATRTDVAGDARSISSRLTVRVALLDTQGHPVTGALRDAFSHSPVFSVDTKAYEADLTRLFSDRKLDAAIIFPMETLVLLKEGRNIPVDVRLSPTSGDKEGLLRAGIDDALLTAASNVQEEADKMTPFFTLDVYPIRDLVRQASVVHALQTTMQMHDRPGEGGDKTSSSPASDRSSVPRVALGMIVMFVMLSLFSEAAFVLDEKTWGTWGRLRTLPLSTGRLIASNILVAFIFGVLQAVLLFVLVTLFIAARPDPWGVLWVSLSLVVASLGLGFFLSLFVKSRTAMMVLSSLFVVGTSMLAGAFWSLDLVSPTMQMVATWMPQGWALDALGLAFNGESGASVYVAGGKLFLTGVIAFSLSLLWSKRALA